MRLAFVQFKVSKSFFTSLAGLIIFYKPIGTLYFCDTRLMSNQQIAFVELRNWQFCPISLLQSLPRKLRMRFYFPLLGTPDLVPWLPPGKPKEKTFNVNAHKKNSGVYDLSASMQPGVWSTKNSKKFSVDSSPWSVRWNKQ